MIFTFKYFYKQFSIALLLIVLSSHLAISAELTESISPLTLDTALGFALQASHFDRCGSATTIGYRGNWRHYFIHHVDLAYSARALPIGL